MVRTNVSQKFGFPNTSPKCLNPPIQRGSTVLIQDAKSFYDPTQITYGRNGLEPQGSLSSALSALERGFATKLFPSGLAALTGSILCLVSPGEEILVIDSIYKRTRRFCDGRLSSLGVRTRYISPLVNPAELAELIGPDTKLLLLESPASLTFEIQDVPALADVARAAGILTLIDNTWAAGVLFKPLVYGVDISIQSLTKYIGGYSDCFMGAAVVREQELFEKFDTAYDDIGWSVSPDDCYQMARGLHTLKTRLSAHARGASTIAEWLQRHQAVETILCPFIPKDPSNRLWQRDFSGHNGLLTCVLKPGPENAVYTFLNALEIFGLGFSWGGFESLALYCNPQMALRTRAFTTKNPVIRLHVGLEDTQSLIDDLENGLAIYMACLS